MTAVETAIAQENPLSIRSALLWGAQVLSRAGIENHRLDCGGAVTPCAGHGEGAALRGRRGADQRRPRSAV